MSARAGAACAVMALATSIAGSARAEVREIAARVADEWARAGGTVTRDTPRFLLETSEERDTTTILLPSVEHGCVTVALVGARGMSFHARLSGVEDDDEPASRVPSVAGLLEASRCGDKAPWHLLVTSDAGRGAIEIVIAKSPTPLPALRTLLPERTGGVLPAPPDPGPAPSLPAQAKRATSAEARAKSEGGTVAPRESWTAETDGTGAGHLRLEPGCHRIEVIAAEGAPARGRRRARLDLDAELRDEDGDLLARDRTDAPDAHLETCVGETTAVTVVFAGAPAGSQAIVTRGLWAIPEHLPTIWGAEARARMAFALRVRHALDPREDAVALYQGAAGATPIPLSIEPGACYIAVAAVTHGHPRGLGLRVSVGARDSTDERTSDDDGGAVAFCAHDRSRARLEVDARGQLLAWGLALFRVVDGGLEVSR